MEKIKSFLGSIVGFTQKVLDALIDAQGFAPAMARASTAKRGIAYTVIIAFLTSVLWVPTGLWFISGDSSAALSSNKAKWIPSEPGYLHNPFKDSALLPPGSEKYFGAPAPDYLVGPDRRELTTEQALELQEAVVRSSVFWLLRDGDGLNKATRTMSYLDIVRNSPDCQPYNPMLILGLAYLESGGVSGIQSPDKPIGLMQLSVAAAIDITKFSKRRIELYDASKNIDRRKNPAYAIPGGCFYLTRMEKIVGPDLLTKLAAYHSPERTRQLKNAAKEEKLISDDQGTYAEIFFKSDAVFSPATYAVSNLMSNEDYGDTYPFKVLAGMHLLEMYVDNPELYARTADIKRKADGKVFGAIFWAWYTKAKAYRFLDLPRIELATESGQLVSVPATGNGYTLVLDGADPIGRWDMPNQLKYCVLTPRALWLLQELSRLFAQSESAFVLRVTSLTRTEPYQILLSAKDGNASLERPMHVAGVAFDIGFTKIDGNQVTATEKAAFEAQLDRLQNIGLISWVYEGDSWHVVVRPES